MAFCVVHPGYVGFSVLSEVLLHAAQDRQCQPVCSHGSVSRDVYALWTVLTLFHSADLQLGMHMCRGVHMWGGLLSLAGCCGLSTVDMLCLGGCC